MAFSDLVASMDNAIFSVLGDSLNVTIHFKDGTTPDVTLPAVTKNPTLADDYIPGSAQGTGVLMLFIRYTSAPPVFHGCTATVTGVDYDIFQVDPDLEGGATLRMRQRKQRWDQ